MKQSLDVLAFIVIIICAMLPPQAPPPPQAPAVVPSDCKCAGTDKDECRCPAKGCPKCKCECGAQRKRTICGGECVCGCNEQKFCHCGER